MWVCGCVVQVLYIPYDVEEFLFTDFPRTIPVGTLKLPLSWVLLHSASVSAVLQP